MESRDDSIVKSLLDHLSLAVWISYYKIFPTESIHIDWFDIDNNMEKFWLNFYKKWLWEYWYTNELDPWTLKKITWTWDQLKKKQQTTSTSIKKHKKLLQTSKIKKTKSLANAELQIKKNCTKQLV